jgi:mannan endo-1,4-beta-mannosidase
MLRYALLLALTMFSAAAGAVETEFVKTAGTAFTLAGEPFFVTGVNNHYLTFGTEGEVTRVLDDAVAMGANTVRVFLQPVIGSLDGSVPTVWNWRNTADSSDLGVNGTYLLYWDNFANHMAVNEGPDGMQKVDFLIAEAKKRKLRLIIAFIDFWSYTGGSKQIQAWYGGANDSMIFFTDERAKDDYKKWISTVIERKNPITGLSYHDDPTIMAWELANEPNAEPEELRYNWIAQMSAFVKRHDTNHLVGSGHANIDIETSEFAIPSIDFVTWHGYPIYLKKSVAQFNERIVQFCQAASDHHKPVLLEEFGYARGNLDQTTAYAQWLRTLARNDNCAGWLVWRLVSQQENGKYPVDQVVQFDIHNDESLVWRVLKAATNLR